MFSPKPQLVVNQMRAATAATGAGGKDEGQSSGGVSKTSNKSSTNTSGNSNKDKDVYVFVSAAGCDGIIKVFINKNNY